MQTAEPYPWVSASVAEGLDRFVLKDLRPGNYLVRLQFAELSNNAVGQRVQNIKLQGEEVLQDFDVVKEAGGAMRGTIRQFSGIEVSSDLTLELSASIGKTIISGIELIRQP